MSSENAIPPSNPDQNSLQLKGTHGKSSGSLGLIGHPLLIAVLIVAVMACVAFFVFQSMFNRIADKIPSPQPPPAYSPVSRVPSTVITSEYKLSMT